MNKLSAQDFCNALCSCGLGPGDIVHVQSDLRRIGLVDSASNKEAMLKFYLDGFQDVLGKDGTLTVCASFEDYGRYGTPFVREESPSRTDTFSEYIRTRPGAARSMHPIMSVTGLGARAEEICDGAHYEGFSYDSPWGRLHRANAWIMSLGLGPDQGGATFFHYVEQIYGVPYQYVKIYTAPVIAGGQKIKRSFTLSVRYLDFGINNVPNRIKGLLVERGAAKIVPVGNGVIWVARAQEAADIFMEMLGEDRYFYLDKPPTFRQGEIPMDGPTGPMVESYDKAVAND
ncbi:MAG TPA: AAC(3) family N-acetyltransferase [Nitrospirae bacterium]|nr:AAC(3) family N-acetyltransferase [Nitrospirota bacterium]